MSRYIDADALVDTLDILSPIMASHEDYTVIRDIVLDMANADTTGDAGNAKTKDEYIRKGNLLDFLLNCSCDGTNREEFRSACAIIRNWVSDWPAADVVSTKTAEGLEEIIEAAESDFRWTLCGVIQPCKLCKYWKDSNAGCHADPDWCRRNAEWRGLKGVQDE